MKDLANAKVSWMLHIQGIRCSTTCCKCQSQWDAPKHLVSFVLLIRSLFLICLCVIGIPFICVSIFVVSLDVLWIPFKHKKKHTPIYKIHQTWATHTTQQILHVGDCRKSRKCHHTCFPQTKLSSGSTNAVAPKVLVLLMLHLQKRCCDMPNPDIDPWDAASPLQGDAPAASCVLNKASASSSTCIAEKTKQSSLTALWIWHLRSTNANWV